MPAKLQEEIPEVKTHEIPEFGHPVLDAWVHNCIEIARTVLDCEFETPDEIMSEIEDQFGPDEKSMDERVEMVELSRNKMILSVMMAVMGRLNYTFIVNDIPENMRPAIFNGFMNKGAKLARKFKIRPFDHDTDSLN